MYVCTVCMHFGLGCHIVHALPTTGLAYARLVQEKNLQLPSGARCYRQPVYLSSSLSIHRPPSTLPIRPANINQSNDSGLSLFASLLVACALSRLGLVSTLQLLWGHPSGACLWVCFDVELAFVGLCLLVCFGLVSVSAGRVAFICGVPSCASTAFAEGLCVNMCLCVCSTRGRPNPRFSIPTWSTHQHCGGSFKRRCAPLRYVHGNKLASSSSVL